MINRRSFIRNSSMVAIGGLLAGKAGVAEASTTSTTNVNAAKIIGLQTYSVLAELGKDVPGGLKRLAKMGYKTLELAGYNSEGRIGQTSMADYKKMADDAGLTIVASHLNPPANVYSPDNKEKIMDFWKKATEHHASIGVKYIIQPGQPSTKSTEEVAYVGEIFNGAGKIAKDGGLSFGYHNHEGEFARVIPGGKESVFGRGGFGRNAPKGQEIIYDGMMKNTDPSLVFFELDVYWCVMGQQDPVEYLKKYADRIKVLHIKDKAVLGQSGMMNFEMIFKQYYANGMKDYFVELEGIRDMTQFEGVQGCANYLLKAKFVK